MADLAYFVEHAREESQESLDIYGEPCDCCDQTGIYIEKDWGMYRPCVECAPSTYATWVDWEGPNLRSAVEALAVSKQDASERPEQG